jgi:hypothetical protein
MQSPYFSISQALAWHRSLINLINLIIINVVHLTDAQATTKD